MLLKLIKYLLIFLVAFGVILAICLLKTAIFEPSIIKMLLTRIGY